MDCILSAGYLKSLKPPGIGEKQLFRRTGRGRRNFGGQGGPGMSLACALPLPVPLHLCQSTVVQLGRTIFDAIVCSNHQREWIPGGSAFCTKWTGAWNRQERPSPIRTGVRANVLLTSKVACMQVTVLASLASMGGRQTRRAVQWRGLESWSTSGGDG